VGVLFSGAGTNFKAILEACVHGDIEAEVAIGITNRPRAGGLAHAAVYQVPVAVVPRTEFDSREAQQAAIADALQAARVDLVACMGFDQILNADPRFRAAGAFDGRMINLHPSLLPAFGGGMHAVRDALEWGAKVTGVTVHFATDDLDAGPVILQEAVAIEEDDTEERLFGRIQAVEHRLVPRAIQLFAEGRLRVEGRRVRVLPLPAMVRNGGAS
jgi:phosphoribosylglycinamide formyltransferase-1